MNSVSESALWQNVAVDAASALLQCAFVSGKQFSLLPMEKLVQHTTFCMISEGLLKNGQESSS